MKKLFIVSWVLLCSLTVELKARSVFIDSTVKNVHAIDGAANEWAEGKFETDKETFLQYAIDHDKENLYFAIRIPDQATQMKLMTLGMKLFIDKKGKKREGTGIEFPLKKEGNPFGGAGRGNRSAQAEPAERPDPKEIREQLAQTMILLKTFGMEDQDDKQQLIILENGVNIAFEWDGNNALFIEYLVPTKFIGSESALAGKPLGIGWVINGFEAGSTGGPTVVRTELVGVPAGSNVSRGGIGRGVVNSNPSRGGNTPASNNDNRMKEQSFWTKYTIN